MTDKEAWIEQFHAIIETAQNGQKRFKAAPWQDEKLIYSHIRESMTELTQHLIDYARERLNPTHEEALAEVEQPEVPQDEYLNLIMERWGDNDHELAS